MAVGFEARPLGSCSNVPLTLAPDPWQNCKQVVVDNTEDDSLSGKNDSPAAAIVDVNVATSTQNDAKNGVSQKISEFDALGQNSSTEVPAVEAGMNLSCGTLGRAAKMIPTL